jgi:glutamate synthase domain-containing protein 3
MVALMIETISEVTEEEVTETLEAIIKQLLQEQHLSETKKRGADWALKQWKNNFI